MILDKVGVVDQIDLFKFVRVSLDAGTDETYSNLHGVSCGWFDQVVNQINLMKIQKDKVGADTVIGISFIVTEENIDEAEKAAELVKSAGADYIQFKAEIYKESFRIPMGAKDKIDKVKEKFESEDFKVFSVRLDGSSAGGVKDYPFCFAHRFIGAMTANGQIQLCCNLKHEYDDKFSFGSLYENTFEEIWNSKRRQKLVDFVEKDPDFVRTHCGQCRMDNINRIFNWIKGYGGMKNFI
jgi:MoaA/NifB/PqqE/SkfB family radical SAM enzyme